MKIVVASGKGGTGKTLVATHLSRFLEPRVERICFVDADVETPNGHLFLTPTSISTWPVTVNVPCLKKQQCAGHGACQSVCAFNAILSARGRIIVFDELCHDCGACLLACPDNALMEKPRVIGQIHHGISGRIEFFSGRLNVGEARGTPLIAEVMRLVHQVSDGWVIVDASPGVACNAVETVKGADLVLLVTEPTPFGQHDVALALQMCRALSLDAAAIVNRSDLGDEQVVRFLENEGVPIIAQIPFDRRIAEAYATGELTSDSNPALAGALASIVSYLHSKQERS